MLNLVVLTKVLSVINAASMYLQSKYADLLKAAHRLKIAFDDMSESEYHTNSKRPSMKNHEFVGFGASKPISRTHVW